MIRYLVEVVDLETSKIVKTLGPYSSERQAERADDGVQHNLNHEAYFTQIVEVVIGMTVTDEMLAELDRSVRVVWPDDYPAVIAAGALLLSELRRLRAENAELKLYAGRYRWLRDSIWYVGPDDFYCGEGGDMNEYQNHNCQAEELDHAIDTAMSAAK